MVTKHKLKYPVLTEETNNKNFKEIILRVSENNEMYIIHRALIQQMNKKRQGTANTKTRSEIQGGGKKPWKQKGTGRARAGSIRSPLWKGGGVIFGPKRKNYDTKINKKEKQLALRTLIYNKFKHTLVTEDLVKNIKKPNTKSILKIIKNLSIDIGKQTKILIIVAYKNSNLHLSLRNLPNIELITANQLNILAILKADKIIITVNALDKINEVYNA
uniref:ribosomal protein L4 n=1 Tax=Anunuuluaehu liula TaxID=3049639 RepID=UPI0030013E4C